MKDISQAVITRLPRYYRYLDELLEDNVERISSGDLSKLMNVTASQIRQDLNNFGGFGQQGYGYNVAFLKEEIGKILGMDKSHNMIVVGAGNLGCALANYANFEKRGFCVIGLFDKNEEIIGKDVKGLKVKSIDELKEFVQNNHVDIAALTLPKTQAVGISKQLVDYGVKAFWNFAHTDLDVPSDIVVENVHLSESLMKLSYRILEMEKKL